MQAIPLQKRKKKIVHRREEKRETLTQTKLKENTRTKAATAKKAALKHKILIAILPRFFHHSSRCNRLKVGKRIPVEKKKHRKKDRHE